VSVLKGTKSRSGALVRRDAGQFGELDVVADVDGDPAAVGVEHVQAVSRGDAPPAALAGGGVQLVLLADGAVAAEQKGHVVQPLVLHHEVRAADHVAVVLDRHVREELEVLRRELGDLPRRRCPAGSPRRRTSTDW
jgi:hypothetical protein